MKRILYLILLLPSLCFAQSINGSLNTYTASGTDTYTITVGFPAAYTTNERYLVRFTNANTGAATLNRDALGAKAIKNGDGTALSANTITAGETKLISYNGTNYYLVGGGAVDLSSKQDVLVSGTNIKTVNGNSLVGSGNVTTTSLTHNTQVSTSYTLVLTDADSKIVETNNASANTVTVPLNSSVAFATGSQIPIVQYGAGTTTVVATGGVTINSSSGSLVSTGQYAVMVLEKRGTDEWYLWNGSSDESSGGTVTNVSALTLGTTGTDLSSSVATSTTTPVITLNVPDASASNRGALTSTDWSTFNNKQSTGLSYLLASGGTATGTNTFTMGSNPFIISTGVTTGTGATAGLRLQANSLTTGNAFDLSSTSNTSGALTSVTSTSTTVDHTAGTHGLVDINSSGANGTSAKTVIGLSSIVTNTNATSGTNIASYNSASGATTANIASQNIGAVLVGSQLPTITAPNGFNHYISTNSTQYTLSGHNASAGSSANTKIILSNDGGLHGDLQANSSTNTALAGANSFNITTSSGSMPLSLGVANVVFYTMNSTNTHTLAQQSKSFSNIFFGATQAAHTGGTPQGFVFNGGAHTTIVAAEVVDANFNFARTVQFAGATGFATQRAVRVQAPTYAFASATGTLTDAFTFSVDGNPAAGTNAAITRPWAAGFNGNVLIGAASGTTGSSLLELQSTTRAFLLMRMTKTQRDAIAAPLAGMVVYQTDNTPGLRVYNGTNWMRFTETAD